MSATCQCANQHFNTHCVQCGKPIDTQLDLLAAKLAVRLNELRDKRPAVPTSWAMDRHMGRVDELSNVIKAINEMRAPKV